MRYEVKDEVKEWLVHLEDFLCDVDNFIDR